MRGFIYDSTGPPVMLRTCCLAQYQTQAPAIEKTVDEKPFNELKRGFYQKIFTKRYKASSDTSLPLSHSSGFSCSYRQLSGPKGIPARRPQPVINVSASRGNHQMK